jgi:hypothetical protein
LTVMFILHGPTINGTTIAGTSLPLRVMSKEEGTAVPERTFGVVLWGPANRNC